MSETGAQIYEAVGQLKAAITQMGGKNVVVIYAFTIDTPKGDHIETGFRSDGLLQALAICEILKHRLLSEFPH